MTDIVVDRVSKSFGDKMVFDRYSATFRGGRMSCLMGPSGCGKTTLLHMLMGLITPDEGVITGVPFRKSAVFQEDRLCESFHAVANVRLACPKSTPPSVVESHLVRIGLEGSLKLPVIRLSGGMRRRVAIVRAILAESDIVFLDEPFKGLDAITRQRVMDYVREQTAGKTVILVTHEPAEAEAMVDDLLNVHNMH